MRQKFYLDEILLQAPGAFGEAQKCPGYYTWELQFNPWPGVKCVLVHYT